MNWASLEQQIARLHHGDHVCSFYKDARDEIPVLVSWLREGLAQGQRCVYVTDQGTADEVAKTLTIFGVDVELERRQGALQFLTKWDWRHEGAFDQELMAAHVKGIVSRSLGPEVKGVWAAVEMSWTRDPDVSAQAVAAWEGMWNDLLMEMPVALLCLYDRREFDPAFLRPELHTHPFVIHDGKVYPNCYYEGLPAAPAGEEDVDALLDFISRQPGGPATSPPAGGPRPAAA